jgi:hypothetical protein
VKIGDVAPNQEEESLLFPGDNYFRVRVPAGQTLITSAYPSLATDAFVAKLYMRANAV